MTAARGMRQKYRKGARQAVKGRPGAWQWGCALAVNWGG